MARAAQHLGIALAEDPIPEQVLFIRSDHYSFVRQGIPSLFLKSGFTTGDAALDGSKINAAYRRDVSGSVCRFSIAPCVRPDDPLNL